MARAIRRVLLRHLPMLADEVAVELGLRGAATARRRPAEPTPTLPDPAELFAVARNDGPVGLDRCLPDDLGTLVKLVGVLGVDPARRVRRWKDAERIRVWLRDAIMERAGRNRRFLEPAVPAGERATAPDRPDTKDGDPEP